MAGGDLQPGVGLGRGHCGHVLRPLGGAGPPPGPPPPRRVPPGARRPPVPPPRLPRRPTARHLRLLPGLARRVQAPPPRQRTGPPSPVPPAPRIRCSRLRPHPTPRRQARPNLAVGPRPRLLRRHGRAARGHRVAVPLQGADEPVPTAYPVRLPHLPHPGARAGVVAFMAAAARAVLGLDLEPQFDQPYLSSSLRDYWGRRWNLSVPAVLRPCVYRPVRAWLGSAPAGVLATFLVSGLMHELMVCYITLRPPTGEATALFALHGACAVAETWWARHDKWWRPPRLAATPLALGFVGVMAFWLFFPPITRHGADKVVIAECEAAIAFLRDVVAWAAGSVRSVWTGHS